MAGWLITKKVPDWCHCDKKNDGWGRGSVGYSATRAGGRLDGTQLETEE